jgi:hypothetical protein
VTNFVDDGRSLGHEELGIRLHQDSDNRGAAILQVLQISQGVRTTTITTSMAMLAAMVMAGEHGQVRWVQQVNEDDVSTKATTMITMTMERTLTTKERGGNLTPPGDAAQRKRYQ